MNNLCIMDLLNKRATGCSFVCAERELNPHALRHGPQPSLSAYSSTSAWMFIIYFAPNLSSGGALEVILKTTIVLDAMGSDDRPQPELLGAIQATAIWNIHIILVGDEPN